MEGNPYSRIVSVMRGETGEQTTVGETAAAGLGAVPAKMRMGTVSQRVPLKITVAGIELPTGALRINERLTKGAKQLVKVTSSNSDYRDLSGSLSGPISCSSSYGSPELGAVTAGKLHSADTVIDKATVAQLEIDLDVGDQVLMLTEDDQIFYILMKVVDAV